MGPMGVPGVWEGQCGPQQPWGSVDKHRGPQLLASPCLVISSHTRSSTCQRPLSCSRSCEDTGCRVSRAVTRSLQLTTSRPHTPNHKYYSSQRPKSLEIVCRLRRNDRSGAGTEGVATPPATPRHPGLRLAYFKSKRSMNSSFPFSSSTSSVKSILKDQNFLYIHLRNVLREVSGT